MLLEGILFWGFAFTIFLAYALVVFMIALSFIWTPFAILISGLIARRKGLSSIRYALLSGMHAILFIFPWIYVTAGMYSRYPSRTIINIYYAVIYILWLLVPVMLAGFRIIITEEQYFFQSSARIGVIILSLLMWGISFWNILCASFENRSSRNQYILDYVYVAPSLYFFVSCILLILDYIVMPYFISDWLG